MGALSSCWRCDTDGESFTVNVNGLTIREFDEVRTVPVPPGLDFTLDAIPCPICKAPMRRVVSMVDLRDWSEQFA